MSRFDTLLPAVQHMPTAGEIARHDLWRAAKGSVAGLALGTLAVLVVAIKRGEWSWDWLIWPPILAALPWVLTLLGCLAVELRAGIKRFESVAGVDLDGDGHVGPDVVPPADPWIIRAAGARLPDANEQLARDVRDVLRLGFLGKRNVSERSWVGKKFENSSKVCTPSRWKRLRQFLVDNGFAVDHGERQGLELVGDYPSACARLGIEE